LLRYVLNESLRLKSLVIRRGARFENRVKETAVVFSVPLTKTLFLRVGSCVHTAPLTSELITRLEISIGTLYLNRSTFVEKVVGRTLISYMAYIMFITSYEW
jgi:hypothetical protein